LIPNSRIFEISIDFFQPQNIAVKLDRSIQIRHHYSNVETTSNFNHEMVNGEWWTVDGE
jgi:hypothetical protein